MWALTHTSLSFLMPMRRMPRREMRLAAFFADNLMNSVAHCGCDESQQPVLVLLIFEKSLNIVKIVKNRLLRKRIKCKCGLIDFGVKEVRICFCIKIVIFCKKNTKTRDLDALEVTVFVK